MIYERISVTVWPSFGDLSKEFSNFSFIFSFSGYPSELFYRGAGMWETLYGLITAYPIVCFIFVPVYLNLGVTSVYQYLDLR